MPMAAKIILLLATMPFFYGCGSSGSNPAALAAACTTPARFAFAADAGNSSSFTVDRTGRFAYMVNSSSNTVSAYTLRAGSGMLNTVAGSPFATGPMPISVVVDPLGKFAYVANAGADNVSVYTIDPASGALTYRHDIAGRPGNLAMAITKDASLVRYTPKFAYVSKKSRTPAPPLKCS